MTSKNTLVNVFTYPQCIVLFIAQLANTCKRTSTIHTFFDFRAIMSAVITLIKILTMTIPCFPLVPGRAITLASSKNVLTFAIAMAKFWARILWSLAAKDACFRMRITLGVVPVRSLVFHVCVLECSWNVSGVRQYLWL